MDFSKKVNEIQKELYKRVFQNLGYIQKGKLLNRVTEDNIVHIVNFSVGRKFVHEKNQLTINFAIFVPEWKDMNFNAELEKGKMYSDEYCWLKTTIGQLKGFQGVHKGYGYFFYDLQTDDEQFIISDAEKVIHEKLLPMFENLLTRDAIIKHADKYAENNMLWIDMIGKKIGKFSVGIIYGARGNIAEANLLMNEYYKEAIVAGMNKGHLTGIINNAKRLGITIRQPDICM